MTQWRRNFERPKSERVLRKFWLAAALIGSSSLGGAAAAQNAQTGSEALVETVAGTIRGVSTENGFTFKGIPFATPPVEELRWRAPAPVRPWSGVRAADEFGPPCAQQPLRGRSEISDQSREDCLYLNVWTPSVSGDDKLPVMVWIHGGAFANGMGTSPTYDGNALSAKGVVVVTLNYRLGVFGFLAHPELTDESSRNSSGNFGLEDQAAALRWVRSNIESFGGDPENVTLFGQSAGGASVLNLVTSSITQGFFRRAIIQSGASRDNMMATPLGQAEEQGRSFAAGRSIADLRELSPAALFDLMSVPAGRTPPRFGPVVDGLLVSDAPMLRENPNTGRTPEILIGSNSREGLFAPDVRELEATFERAFGPNVDRAKAIYRYDRKEADPVLGTAAEQFATDSSFRCGNVRVAGLSVAVGAPTWQYQFEQFVPGREAQGAGHSFEVPYVFGNLSSTGYSAANYGPADRRLSDLMTDYWTNFAKRGDPNGPGLPEWPQYSAYAKRYLRFSSSLPHDAVAATNLGRGICELFADPK